MSLSEKRVHFSGTCSKAFSSEADLASLEENASKWKLEHRTPKAGTGFGTNPMLEQK
jgi:hypothetical protein